MKKLLDQCIVKKATEVDLQNHITLDNKPSLEKGLQPFKKILITKHPKQEKARPLNYNPFSGDGFKFPLPKPILSNGVVPEAL